MNWLLTDEETRQVNIKAGQEYMIGIRYGESIPFEVYCNTAQNRAQLRKLVEVLEEKFDHLIIGDDIMTVTGHDNKGGPYSYFQMRLTDWQSLRKEAGLE